MQKISKYIKMAALSLSVMAAVIGFSPVKAQADETTITSKIETLKTKFPQGKYWNHVGMANDNSNGVTGSPCTLHRVAGVNHVAGTGGCTCNHFSDAKYGNNGQMIAGHLSATQCMGFANKLANEVFGQTSWYKYGNPSAAQIATIKVGDIVRLTNHSVFVVARSGNVITIAEANYPNGCQINWGRQVDLTKETLEYFEHASNYDSITGSSSVTPQQPTIEQPTTEQPTTEQPAVKVENNKWIAAADGVHYQYYVNGELQKNKWLEKNTTYADNNGYRVTGLVTIQGNLYFFDNTGKKQTKKWVNANDNDYYVCGDGSVLKSQWLYKNDVCVYVKKTGAVAKDEILKIGSKRYAFDAEGKRGSGFRKIAGKYYYCNGKGVISRKKWITVKKKTYYVDKKGVRMTSQLVKINGYQYYFDKKGRLVKNKKVTCDGVIYKANKKGRCKKIGVVPTTEASTQEVKTESNTEATTEMKTEK